MATVNWSGGLVWNFNAPGLGSDDGDGVLSSSESVEFQNKFTLKSIRDYLFIKLSFYHNDCESDDWQLILRIAGEEFHDPILI